MVAAAKTSQQNGINMINSLSKMVLKTYVSVQTSKLCTFWTIRFDLNFCQYVGPNTYQIMYRKTLEF